MTTLAFDIVGHDKSGSKAIESLGDTADKIHGKLKVVSANAIAGLAEAGAMAGQAFSAALMNATEAESANDKLSAQLGFSGEIAKEFGAAAGQLYSEAYGENLGEVNDALKAVWQQGLVDEDAATEDIKAVAATALDFSSAMEQDMDRVTSAVGTMLKTGMAKNATEAFDVLTRGFQQGANKADDLLDTFIEYSTQFRKLGLDATTATGLLSQGLKGGARDADTVADALKEFSIRAIDGSKASGEAFKALGINGKQMAADIAAGGPKATAALGTVLEKLRGMKNPVDQSAAAVGLFGTKAEDLGAALFSLNPTTAVNALGQVAGASAEMGKTLADNAETKITMFTRSMETGFNEFLASNVIPILVTAIEWIRGFGNVLESMGIKVSDVVIPAIAALGAAVLAAGVKMAIGWLTGLGPIYIIGIAVVALAALIISNWDKIVAFLKATWEVIKSVAEAGLNFVKGRWSDFVGFLSGVVSGIARIASGMWDAARDSVVRAKQWIVDRWNDIIAFFGSIPRRIGEAFGSLGRILGDALKGAFNVGIDAINWFIDRANSAIHGINVINPFSDIPSIPKIGRMHSGGTVPGPLGMERLTILEAGETVLPVGAGRGGGGSLVVNINAPIGSRQELENWLVRTMDNLNRRGRFA